jgi:hypothetical protein
MKLRWHLAALVVAPVEGIGVPPPSRPVPVADALPI